MFLVEPPLTTLHLFASAGVQSIYDILCKTPHAALEMADILAVEGVLSLLPRKELRALLPSREEEQGYAMKLTIVICDVVLKLVHTHSFDPDSREISCIIGAVGDTLLQCDAIRGNRQCMERIGSLIIVNNDTTSFQQLG